MLKRLSKGFITFSLLALTLYASAQKSKDTDLVIRKSIPWPDPHKAMLCSVILPGAGQLYNKHWWKVPIIYAGFGAFTYFAITNGEQYNMYHSALVDRNKGVPDPYINIYTSDDLVSLYDYYNRYMWLSIFGDAFIYLLNVVDANVDAQMHSFDVSDNLSFKFTPLLNTDYSNGRTTISPGFTLIKRF